MVSVEEGEEEKGGRVVGQLLTWGDQIFPKYFVWEDR